MENIGRVCAAAAWRLKEEGVPDSSRRTLTAAGEMGIPVSNVPSYGSEAVAQHTWGLILELCNRVGSEASAVSKGAWSDYGSWSHWSHPMVELNGRRLGILGRGAIARRVAEIGRAFGRVGFAGGNAGDFRCALAPLPACRGK